MVQAPYHVVETENYVSQNDAHLTEIESQKAHLIVKVQRFTTALPRLLPRCTAA